MSIDPKELEEFETLCNAATKGPWWVGSWKNENIVCVQAEPVPSSIYELPIDKADARFIAASRTMVPKLLEEIKRLKEANKWLKGGLDIYKEGADKNAAFAETATKLIDAKVLEIEQYKQAVKVMAQALSKVSAPQCESQYCNCPDCGHLTDVLKVLGSPAVKKVLEK